MFKNRAVKITMDKQRDNTPREPHDNRPVEEKAKAVLHVFEKVAVKAFAGVCIYVLLDTHRQVAVAKASHPE